MQRVLLGVELPPQDHARRRAKVGAAGEETRALALADGTPAQFHRQRVVVLG